MKKMELTCVVCPNGCLLTVWQENGETKVEGAACKNGIASVQKNAATGKIELQKD